MGSTKLYPPFLNERRTRGRVQGCVQEIRGISLVFREMWDTTAFDLRTVEPKRSISLRSTVPTLRKKREGWGTGGFVTT